MFRNNDRKPAAQHLYRRIYCALFAMMAAGNVLAEDDVVDADPNFGIFGAFLNLWDFLTGLVA